jgi:ribosome-associated heat shock protein Hsp15
MTDAVSAGKAPRDERLRLDKWLWHARFFKSRSLATRACAAGRVRINRALVSKSHATVKPGDVLTFPLGSVIRVIEIVALGVRRGPAPEAQALYSDLAPHIDPAAPLRAGARPARMAAVAARDLGAGRPTKADRRAIARLKDDTR